MVLKNIELKSKHITVSNSPTNLGLGAVPNGMMRFITFVKFNNEYAGANAIYLCSGTTATDATSGNIKDKQYLSSQYDTIAYPGNPNPNTPLFSIASNKYLSAYTSAGKMGIFIQYYDE